MVRSSRGSDSARRQHLGHENGDQFFAGSIQNDVVAAPPQAYSPALPGTMFAWGSSDLEAKTEPMPL